MWCAIAATYGAVPGTASHCGASSARIASAVVSSAMTFAYGARRASAWPERLHDRGPLRDRNLHALLPAVAEALSGSFIGLTYCSVMWSRSCSVRRRRRGTRAYAASMPGFRLPPHALPFVVNCGGALLTKPVRIGTPAVVRGAQERQARRVVGELASARGRGS